MSLRNASNRGVKTEAAYPPPIPQPGSKPGAAAITALAKSLQKLELAAAESEARYEKALAAAVLAAESETFQAGQAQPLVDALLQRTSRAEAHKILSSAIAARSRELQKRFKEEYRKTLRAQIQEISTRLDQLKKELAAVDKAEGAE